MHKKEKLRLLKNLNCKTIVLTEWELYIAECRTLISRSQSMVDDTFLTQLEETKSKLNAFANSPDVLKCKAGSMDELVCMLEKLGVEEIDQLVNGLNMHLKIIDSLMRGETNEKDKALMENTYFDLNEILNHLVRIFGVIIRTE